MKKKTSCAVSIAAHGGWFPTDLYPVSFPRSHHNSSVSLCKRSDICQARNNTYPA